MLNVVMMEHKRDMTLSITIKIWHSALKTFDISSVWHNGEGIYANCQIFSVMLSVALYNVKLNQHKRIQINYIKM
jgi:hypothetical protein